MLLSSLEQAAGLANPQGHFLLAALYRCGRPNPYLYEESLKGRVLTVIERGWVDDYLRLGSTRFFPRSRIRQILEKNKLFSNDCIEVPVKNEYRVHHPELSPEVRKTMFGEVEQIISSEDAYKESMRCMRFKES